jgi:Leucine-rich repeat (LRR) protein
MLKKPYFGLLVLFLMPPLAQAATDCAVVTEIPSTECEALVALYNSTGGDNWSYNTGWNVTNTPCSWHEVRCSGGQVSELSLVENQLSGTIPPELGQLSRLRYLYLSSNQLSGTIPPELGQLSRLQFLDMSENQFSGTIPPELGQLNSLQHLNLSSSQLSGTIPPELGQLSSLTYLQLDKNQLSGTIPPELGQLSSLTYLQLSWNQLSGTIPPELGQLSRLEELYLDYNQLSGTIPPELGQLSRLRGLSLHGAGQFSGTIPPELGQLISLTSLDLSFNQLSGTIPPKLGLLSRLRNLNLGGNQLRGAIPPELGQLSNLRGLWLSSNQLSGTIPPELGQLSSLWHLELCWNQLSGTIPPELGQLSSLGYYLCLSDNRLSGTIPPELGQLSGLQRLSLSENQLSGTIPPELGQLSSLQHLHMDFNQLCGEIPSELMNLTNLEPSPDGLKLQNNDLINSDTDYDANFIAWLDQKEPNWRTQISPSYCSNNLLQFSATNYNVNEGDGSATITVTRSGDTQGAVSVDYATSSDGSADNSDYTHTEGTLNWADGDSANKTFTINITDDSESESDETLIVSLNNATGTELGSPKTAVLTITDNDSNNPQSNAAIIIAGGGSDDTNTLWDTTAATSNYIYKMLYKRGFKHEEIDYLSPQSYADINGDGLDDDIVDIPKTPRALKVEDVREVFTRAKNRGRLNQPLYVFFTDHGGPSRVLIAKNSYLEVEDFKAILDDYQNETGNQVALVIDTCYSGSLLQKLIAPNRAIISSTGDGLAYFDRSSKQGFSRFFAEGLLKGMNFSEAFNYAHKEQTKLVNSFFDDRDQNPQWHDGRDGQWLQNLFINRDFTVGDFTLTVSAITPSNKDLQADDTLPLMAEIIIAKGTIEKAWAVLKPPKINIVMDSYGTPILSFPRLKLSRTQKENIWASTWGDAVYNGEYEIIFSAEDNEGNIDSSEPITINVIGGVESPEKSSVRIELEKESYNLGEHFQARLIEELGWGYDLYAAVVIPDGNFFALTKENEFAPVNEAAKWEKQRKPHSSVILLDLILPDNLPIGEYCLYGILSPEDESVLETVEMWEWTLRCFEVQK